MDRPSLEILSSTVILMPELSPIEAPEGMPTGGLPGVGVVSGASSDDNDHDQKKGDDFFSLLQLSLKQAEGATMAQLPAFSAPLKPTLPSGEAEAPPERGGRIDQVGHTLLQGSFRLVDWRFPEQTDADEPPPSLSSVESVPRRQMPAPGTPQETAFSPLPQPAADAQETTGETPRLDSSPTLTAENPWAQTGEGLDAGQDRHGERSAIDRDPSGLLFPPPPDAHKISGESPKPENRPGPTPSTPPVEVPGNSPLETSANAAAAGRRSSAVRAAFGDDPADVRPPLSADADGAVPRAPEPDAPPEPIHMSGPSPSKPTAGVMAAERYSAAAPASGPDFAATHPASSPAAERAVPQASESDDPPEPIHMSGPWSSKPMAAAMAAERHPAAAAASGPDSAATHPDFSPAPERDVPRAPEPDDRAMSTRPPTPTGEAFSTPPVGTTTSAPEGERGGAAESPFRLGGTAVPPLQPSQTKTEAPESLPSDGRQAATPDQPPTWGASHRSFSPPGLQTEAPGLPAHTSESANAPKPVEQEGDPAVAPSPLHPTLAQESPDPIEGLVQRILEGLRNDWKSEGSPQGEEIDFQILTPPSATRAADRSAEILTPPPEAPAADTAAAKEAGRVWIRLQPDNLGKIEGEIVVEQDRLWARFLTDDPATKDVLEQNLDRLRDALREQGLRLEPISIVVEFVSSAQLSGNLAHFPFAGRGTARWPSPPEGRSEGRKETPRESQGKRISGEGGRTTVDLFV